jgi:hypothetical protein
MTQADRVLSTPPTNASKITPVDPTRRRFLTVAAIGSIAGAGSLALAAAAPAPGIPAALAITTTQAAGSPQAPLFSPALRAAALDMDAALVGLKDARANFWALDASVDDGLNAAHPKPKGKRALRKWTKYRERVRLDTLTQAWDRQRDAEEAYRKAQMGLATYRVRDRHELVAKAALATLYDIEELSTGRHALISFGVAMDVALLDGRAVQS